MLEFIFWFIVGLIVVIWLLSCGAWSERMNPYSESNLLIDEYEDELSYYNTLEEEDQKRS